MKLKQCILTAMSVPIMTAWLGAGTIAQEAQPVKRTELLRNDLGGVEGREVVVFTAEIVPGGTAPKHTHPGDEVVYVLQGTWIFEPEGKAAVILKAGELIDVPSGVVHAAKNGSDKEITKALVFLVSEKGKPLTTLMQ